MDVVARSAKFHPAPHRPLPPRGSCDGFSGCPNVRASAAINFYILRSRAADPPWPSCIRCFCLRSKPWQSGIQLAPARSAAQSHGSGKSSEDAPGSLSGPPLYALRVPCSPAGCCCHCRDDISKKSQARLFVTVKAQAQSRQCELVRPCCLLRRLRHGARPREAGAPQLDNGRAGRSKRPSSKSEILC